MSAIRISLPAVRILNEWISSFVGIPVDGVTDFALDCIDGGADETLGFGNEGYVNLLMRLDDGLNTDEFAPTWEDMHEDNIYNRSLELAGIEATVRKVNDDFLYLHAMVVIFFGGIWREYQIKHAIKTNEKLLEEIYLDLKAHVAARRLAVAETAAETATPEASFAHLSIDAAGGMAQALERQDLEGGLTNGGEAFISAKDDIKADDLPEAKKKSS